MSEDSYVVDDLKDEDSMVMDLEEEEEMEHMYSTL
jgi:hypothetical protein